MNPYLPAWEYIPDGEPKAFGDRVYIYGSHDQAAADEFCDFKIKVWSASVDDLNNWVDHGHIFHTKADHDHESDTAHYTQNRLFAPDVAENNGKYYLYCYIVGARGCVAVADRPEGPFKFLSQYQYKEGDAGDNGIFNDPGVLVDGDKAYIYYGFEGSNVNELNAKNMYEIIEDSLVQHEMADGQDVPVEQRFYEASSPKKINGLYYLIYSPRSSSQLAYATADNPKGPFKFRGHIIDSGKDYPGGNNHGSIVKIKDQWYVFYHRMTNNTIMSRRGCVEKIEILPDGTIPEVEPTSLGFEDALNPFKITPAEACCVLSENAYITEHDIFERVIANIKHGTVIGYKYFDFGEDFRPGTMTIAVKVRGRGVKCKLHVFADAPAFPEDSDKLKSQWGYADLAIEAEGGEKPLSENEIGVIDIGTGDGVYKGRVKTLTGRHAVYFVAEQTTRGWMRGYFESRDLFEFVEFAFMK